MSRTHQNNEISGVHKWPLLGALGLVLLTLMLVIGSVLTKKEAASNTQTLSERSLYFLDGHEGRVVVYDAKTKKKIASFSKGEGAFIRISMRSMMRQRTLKKIDHTLPFKLIKTGDGNLSITDPQSGDRIRINAFGRVAVESFAQFLPHNQPSQGAEG